MWHAISICVLFLIRYISYMEYSQRYLFSIELENICMYWSCTSGDILDPLKSDLGVFWAKIPLSSDWFYNVKTQKTFFLQNSSWDKAEIENIHCPICTQPISSSWQNALPPAFAPLEQRGGLWSHSSSPLVFSLSISQWKLHKDKLTPNPALFTNIRIIWIEASKIQKRLRQFPSPLQLRRHFYF